MTSLPRYVSCSTALDDVRWRRSSHSTGANNCVEAAYPVGPESAGLIAVRDSTHVEGLAAAVPGRGVAGVRRGAQ